MAAVHTHADALNEWLTGATSDGGVQTNPSASLGRYRSATEAASFGITLANMLANVVIDFASGGCAPGVGQLTAVDSANVTWQDALYGPGPVCNLPSNGSVGIAEANGNQASYVRLRRTSAGGISGGPTLVTLTTLYNNQYGMDDVAAADAAAGLSQYRATILRNESAALVGNIKRWLTPLGTTRVSDAGTLTTSGGGTVATTGSFADWPPTGWCRILTSTGGLKEIVYYSGRTNTALTVPAAGRGRFGTATPAGTATDLIVPVPGVAVGLEPGGAQAFGSAIQVIASQLVAPAGVSWVTGHDQASGLAVPSLNVSQQIGIWEWRQTPAGAVASPSVLNGFSTSYDSA